jgi:hypothetical protein
VVAAVIEQRAANRSLQVQAALLGDTAEALFAGTITTHPVADVQIGIACRR